jgi:hypothetical protein
MGTGVPYPKGKATESWSWPLPRGAEIKNTWIYISFPQ